MAPQGGTPARFLSPSDAHVAENHGVLGPRESGCEENLIESLPFTVKPANAATTKDAVKLVAQRDERGDWS